ncbi:hypothetical protein [Pseudomonas sp. TH41]|uniref:hypothetical protein n=1 Tax=Pseudomonas sp. TH41 TaxID=2796405 RepID=UPI001F5BEE44|nr:hypothetical protein [Pseudomonas sp. TH41]
MRTLTALNPMDMKNSLRQRILVVDAQVKLENYRLLTLSADPSADMVWFIQWLQEELEKEFGV